MLNQALFTQTTGGMVIVKDIELHSLCEHHLVPFYGRCHIGYIPDGKVFEFGDGARMRPGMESAPVRAASPNW